MLGDILKIGILGIGFVGNAVYEYMKKTSYEIHIYDKYKNIGSINNILCTDILFLCLPTPFCDTLNTYDMTEINNTIELLNDNNYKGIILIKSTVIPDYCIMINNKYQNIYIVNNPEFLTARTAVEDFANQSHIILGYTLQSKIIIEKVNIFYKEIFPNAIISVTDSISSSMTKLACNSFYATKIQYFTEIYLLCQKLDISYDEVKKLMLMNGWINPMHTNIPGPDNLISFGGACFPKDTKALNQFLIQNNVCNMVIDNVIQEMNIMRK